MFLEGELSDSEHNGINIQKVGAPCTQQNGACEQYEIGFNLEFFAIRSEILFE